jgi:hypothetical protein
MQEVFEMIGCAVTGGNIYVAVGAGVIVCVIVILWDVITTISKRCSSRVCEKKGEKERGASYGAMGCMGIFLLITSVVLLKFIPLQHRIVVDVLVLFAMALLCLAVVPTAFRTVIKEIGIALGWEECFNRRVEETDKGQSDDVSGVIAYSTDIQKTYMEDVKKDNEQSRYRPKPQTKMCPHRKAYVCKKETPCSGSCLPKIGY